MRVIVCGRFSGEGATAVASELMSAAFVSSWLTSRAIPHDVAWGSSRPGGRLLTEFPVERYTHLVLVGTAPAEADARGGADRFSHTTTIGVGPALEHTEGLERIIARDDAGRFHPDPSLRTVTDTPPLVGLHMPDGWDRTDGSAAAVGEVLEALDVATLPVRTVVDADASPLTGTARRPAHALSVLRRLDVLVTTSGDGMLAALSVAVPALVLDPGSGHAARQAEATGWPWVLSAKDADRSSLRTALDELLGRRARRAAQDTLRDARVRLAALDRGLSEVLSAGSRRPEPRPQGSGV